MSVSMKNICVYDDKVYEIPLTKIKNGKMEAPKLAGKTVLKVELIYEIKNRKPYKPLRILFDKITFNDDGIYEISESSAENQIKLEYIFAGIGPESSPLPIPIAPVIPSVKEIELLKEHLNRKYPALLENNRYAIEDAINESVEFHKENIGKMKRSHRESPNKK